MVVQVLHLLLLLLLLLLLDGRCRQADHLAFASPPDPANVLALLEAVQPAV